ncbi:MAG: DUF169 domain-containing protein [Spirochaetia bacterium]
MQNGFKKQSAERWERFFPGASLPICFYYTDDEQQAEPVKPYPGMHCLMRDLSRVSAGESLSFASNTVGCAGGRYYLGFSLRLPPNFNYFFSCGIPGELEGERYKASRALASFDESDPQAVIAPPVGTASRVDTGHPMAEIPSDGVRDGGELSHH